MQSLQSLQEWMDTPNYWKFINGVHAFVAGPVIAWTGWKLLNGQSVNTNIKSVLAGVGAVVIAFHSLRAYQTKSEHPDVGMLELATHHPKFQVNLAHALFVGPLVAWVGYKLSNGRSATQLEKLLMLILGSSATVYHAMKLYQRW